MFVRFVAGTDDENAFWLDGIFTAAARLCAEDQLYSFEMEWLEQVFTWFGEDLPVPPFRRMHATGQWTQQAVSWFFDSAGEPLRRMCDLVAILREHGTPVRFVRAALTTQTMAKTHQQTRMILLAMDSGMGARLIYLILPFVFLLIELLHSFVECIDERGIWVTDLEPT